MTTPPPDQQPIQRTVGRRRIAPVGAIPGPEARAAMDALARFSTGFPKGVFRYANHQQMEADRLRWTAEAMAALARQRESRR